MSYLKKSCITLGTKLYFYTVDKNIKSSKSLIGGRTSSLVLLLIYLSIMPIYSQSEAFSKVMVSYDISALNSLRQPASQYWEVTKSDQVNFEFPFYWQFVNVRFQTSEFSGKTYEGMVSPDFKEYYIALGWVARWQFTDLLGVQAGFSLGDHSMVFSHEVIMGLKNENEFGIGLECLIYLNLYKGLRFQTSYSKNMVFTSSRFHHDSILFGLGYEMNTPQFLMTFLK